ncbi:class I SAM-dependent methyltransferase [Acanthopleuribacter pedis]|uniref:Class I SAM-dependent methyltransferase n=1 Tax=Acanthopleuribacter pedis TaxID=442870 RepID=A0A8J7QNX5_9BACT|nr:class I SAM-dependent methyltransferase [Acanthopleuribacter pedis]MBO1321923.1 class I SAM-dependent methyltransferase [Acanthopleuribacter pedis]
MHLSQHHAIINESVRWWDRKAAGYAKQPIADMAAYEQKLAQTRAYLKPQSRVLEFGCGTGSTALAHAPYVAHIDATDSSGNMIAIAREKAKQAAITNVTFTQASLAEVAARPTRYDVVLGLNVVHLMNDWEESIRQAHSLLKPGGVFVSSTACIARAPLWMRLLLPLGGTLGLIPKVVVFTHEALTAAMTDAGFQLRTNAMINHHGMTAFMIGQREKD